MWISSIVSTVIGGIGVAATNYLFKMKEQSGIKYDKKQVNLEKHIQKINQEMGSVLIKWPNDYLVNGWDKRDEEGYVDRFFEEQVVNLLYEYQRFFSLYDTTLEAENKKKSNMDNTNNFDPKGQIPEKLYSMLLDENFLNYKTKIEEDFPQLAKVIKRILELKNSDASDKSSLDDAFGVKSSDAKSPDTKSQIIDANFLGTWITTPDRAKKVKYLVGVSNINKQVIAIYKLKGIENTSDEEDGRIRFKQDQEVSRIDVYKENSDKISRIFKNWDSRNPVLYYNKWSQAKAVNDPLKELIANKYQDKNNDGDDDIIIVRTNDFAKPVNSNDIRTQIPIIYKKNRKDEMERSELIKNLQIAFPYVIDHTGVYEGVFNKLNNSEKTRIYKAGSSKGEMLERKNKGSETLFKFVSTEPSR